MYYTDIMTQQNSTPLGNGNCSISKHNMHILMTWCCLYVHVSYQKGHTYPIGYT